MASGTWTGLRWVVAPEAAPLASPADNGVDDSYHLFGWSSGYVAFRTHFSGPELGQPASTLSVVIETSADGLHWAVGQSLDVKGLAEFVGVSQLVEGPAGLVAVGKHEGSACGGPMAVAALWTSSDGITWSRIDVAKAFGANNVYSVEAGGAGYVATGESQTGAVQRVWISSDGKTWHPSQLPAAISGKVVIDGATAFGGGFVVAGAVLGDVGCGSSTLNPALWLSASGKTWTRATLSGAMAAPEASIWVSRINDHA